VQRIWRKHGVQPCPAEIVLPDLVQHQQKIDDAAQRGSLHPVYYPV